MKKSFVCKSVRIMAYVSAWSASTSSAATEHGTGPLLQSTAWAATEHNAHHTHLAAVILDAAMERTALSGYPTAARKEAWFKKLKRDIIDVTFVPLTRCTLARRSARPPGKKTQERRYMAYKHGVNFAMCCSLSSGCQCSRAYTLRRNC